MKAYSGSILSGEAAPSSDGGEEAPFWMMCGTCAPSDVEQALAKQAETSKEVPPIVWLLTPEAIESKTKEILEATKANLDAIGGLPLEQVTPMPGLRYSDLQ